MEKNKKPHAKNTHDAGLAAEFWARLWMRLCGYKILAHRFKTPVGEVDIIAKNKGALVFVEVKRRKLGADALSAVTPQNMARVRRAAEWWLKQNASVADKCDIRFDVVAVAPYCYIKHIQNAF